MLAEKKLGGLPQAEDPTKWSGGFGSAKSKPIDPKAPKAKSLGKSAEGTKKTKFAKKPRPLETGKVDGGKPESAPRAKSLGKSATGSKMSPAKPERQKIATGSKSSLPDARDVKTRGLGDRDAGEATATIKNSIAKAAAKSPSAGKIQVGKAKIVKPEFGFGLLKAGSVMDPLGNLDGKMKEVGKVKLGEGRVIAGRVSVVVGGKRRAVFEAATPEVIARAALDFAEVGARVSIESVVRGRKIYEDRAYSTALLESVHAADHGLDTRAKESALAAVKIAARLLREERDPRIHATVGAWTRECVMPLVRQGLREVRAAYREALVEHDVIVHGEKGTRRSVVVRAIDERHAAVKAIDEALTESAGDSPTKVFVGAKKYLPESATFMRWPERFGAVSVPKDKTKEGSVSSVKAPKAATVVVGRGKVSGVKKLQSSGDKMVDRSKYVKTIKEARTIREEAAAKVMDLIKKFTEASTGETKMAAEELAEMVESGSQLTKRQSEALDKFIHIALKRS